MPNLRSVGVASGVPNSGTGTVSTLDAVLDELQCINGTVVKSTAAESSHVLKSSAGILKSLSVTLGATSGWIMVFDAVSAPADGAVTPIWWCPVDSDGTKGFASFSFVHPLPCATGITAVFSTSGPFAKAASSTASFSAIVQ